MCRKEVHAQQFNISAENKLKLKKKNQNSYHGQ